MGSLVPLPLTGGGLWWAQSPFSPWCTARLQISVGPALALSEVAEVPAGGPGGSVLPISVLSLGSSSCTSSAVPLVHTSPI